MITKTDLVAGIAESHGMTKVLAASIVDSVFDDIGKGIKEHDEVRITGFGSFSVTERAATVGRNPRTGESIEIAARRVVKFKAAAALVGAVAK